MSKPVPIRRILHADMDAFFASVEQIDRHLRGQPVIVGSAPDQRGVVSAASYEARRYGVRSAMPSATAGRLCPNGIFVPPRMKLYSKVSRHIMKLFRQCTPIVEQISVDEAFLDVTGCTNSLEEAVEAAEQIRTQVQHDTGLTLSFGLAPNKLLAKLASDIQKPNGFTQVPFTADAIASFLAPLAVNRLWGVGPKLDAQLKKIGIRTIGDLQRFPLAHLIQITGTRSAHHLHQLAYGIDERPVKAEAEPEKSISNEITYDEDCRNERQLKQSLISLAEKVGMRLRHAGYRARTLQIKLRDSQFKTITRSKTLAKGTAADKVFIETALHLFNENWDESAIRLIGFGVSNLERPEIERQPSLFEDEQVITEDPLDATLDALRQRFGNRIIGRKIL